MKVIAGMLVVGFLIAGAASAFTAAPASAAGTDAVTPAAGTGAVTAAAGTDAVTAASPPGAPPLVPNQPVSELNVPKAACGVAGVINKAVGIACGVLSNGGALLKGGKQLLNGNVNGAVSTVLGGGGTGAASGGTAAATASTGLGLLAIGAWVVVGAGAVLHEAGAALGAITTPQLNSTWFSATYWRMAAIAAMLTLPFLFAATVQALVRSDVMLLARAALGYLPLAILAIAIAAPLTTLLLSASDQLSGLISSAAGDQGPHLVHRIGIAIIGLSIIAGSPFLAFLIGLFTIGAAFALWVELLLREAAVYVVVLMLPLAFAALAWPARRIWAVRAVEILVALILSKFAVVAVLSLGGAAISAGSGHFGVTDVMAGTVLMVLAALSPWALLRLVPLAEVASAAMGSLRGEIRSAGTSTETGTGLARSGDDWATSTSAAMKRDAEMGMADGGEPLRQPTADRSTGNGGEPPDAGAEEPTSGGPPTLDDGPTTSGDPPPPDDGRTTSADPEPPAPPQRRWSEESVLELGPNFGETKVSPHPEAE